MMKEMLGYMVASVLNVVCQLDGWPCQRTYDVSANTSKVTPCAITLFSQYMLAPRSPPLSMCRTVLMLGSTCLTAWMPAFSSMAKLAQLLLLPLTGGSVADVG